MEYLMYLAALALIAAGVAGTVIPAIPGLPLIFAGGWLIAWASGWELIGVITVVVLALLAAVGIGVDTLAQILGAKKAGASRAGLWGAVIGTLLGLATGVFGIVFFPLVGAVAGEIFAGKTLLDAGKIGIATWIGMAVGLGVKIALAFTMVGLILFNVVANSAIGHFWSGSSEAVAATAADVPQAPGDAAPIESYPGKPEPRRYVAPKPAEAPAEAASAEAAPAAPAADAASPAAPAAAEPAASAADPLAGVLAEKPVHEEPPHAAPAAEASPAAP